MPALRKNDRKSQSVPGSKSGTKGDVISDAPTEADLWKPLQNLAEGAIAFWRDFLDLRAVQDKLNDDQIRRFVMLIRAVSWVESRHGTGTGHCPARDPMQCGNPEDAWWPQLAGLSGNGDRFVGGPDAKNYWAKELPDAAADTALPALAKLSELSDVAQGHRDSAFNPTMSFFWAVPHLIWKTNVPKNGKAFQCNSVSRDDLLDGATAYNGKGDPDYRAKIDAALTSVGWPAAVTLDVAAAAASFDDLVLQRSSALIEDAMRSIEQRSQQPKFFPHGITKIVISLNLGKEAGFSLTVEGPQQASSSIGNGTRRYDFEMEDHAPPPPPPPPPSPGDPHPATASDIATLNLSAPKSIAGAASLFRKACAGGDTYKNNCAHFLSDAFIRAGYTELEPPSDCIHARCSTSARRPIRARDMQCWFDHMARETRTELPKKEGLWAVFQLDGNVYPGGHVVLIDTDSNAYYGTANYPSWHQYCYKW